MDESLRTVYFTIQPSELTRGESARDLAKRISKERRSSASDLDIDGLPWLDISSSGALDFYDPRMNQSVNDLFWEEDQTAISRKKNEAKKKKKEKLARNKAANSKPDVASKKKELKQKFFKLLRSVSAGEKLDSKEIISMMNEEPSVTRSKYLLSCFPEPVMALHFLSAFNAPLECIQKCYRLNPEALSDATSSVGTPFHLACNRKVALRVIRYFASQDADALLVVNHTKRTPLHVAVASGADVELVALLTEACPEAAALADIAGRTPLDLAVADREPDIDVIEDLISVYPKALAQGALHSAARNISLGTEILKMLVLKWPKALKTVDDGENTPVHAAVLSKRPYKDLKVMAKKYPKGLHRVNEDGETAFQVAKRLGLSDDVLAVLRPNNDDLV